MGTYKKKEKFEAIQWDGTFSGFSEVVDWAGKFNPDSMGTCSLSAVKCPDDPMTRDSGFMSIESLQTGEEVDLEEFGWLVIEKIDDPDDQPWFYSLSDKLFKENFYKVKS